MPFKAVTVPNNVASPVTLEVIMPPFNPEAQIMINYQICLIYGNTNQVIGRGTNTDMIPDNFRVPIYDQDLKGKLIRIDYFLINGNNVNVSFNCFISNQIETIQDNLNDRISLSCFIFN